MSVQYAEISNFMYGDHEFDPLLHSSPSVIVLPTIYHYLTAGINGGKSNFLKDICTF